jgi:hypothetical protein
LPALDIGCPVDRGIAKNSRSLPIIWYSALLPHDQIELGLVHFFPIQSIVEKSPGDPIKL